jgi:hypothetical protein
MFSCEGHRRNLHVTLQAAGTACQNLFWRLRAAKECRIWAEGYYLYMEGGYIAGMLFWLASRLFEKSEDYDALRKGDLAVFIAFVLIPQCGIVSLFSPAICEGGRIVAMAKAVAEYSPDEQLAREVRASDTFYLYEGRLTGLTGRHFFWNIERSRKRRTLHLESVPRWRRAANGALSGDGRHREQRKSMCMG